MDFGFGRLPTPCIEGDWSDSCVTFSHLVPSGTLEGFPTVLAPFFFRVDEALFDDSELDFVGVRLREFRCQKPLLLRHGLEFSSGAAMVLSDEVARFCMLQQLYGNPPIPGEGAT